MNKLADKAAEPRRRNAEDSRQRLLLAAGELFAERGYEGTTIREIGQHAGIDPTLIARYFGSKAGLYLAALRLGTTPSDAKGVDVTDPNRILRLLDRVASNGPTPTFYAAVRPHSDVELQTAAMELIQQRLLAPSAATALAADLDDSQLRAEIVIAALAGIVLSRTSGAFDTLSGASADEVAPLVAELLSSLLTRSL